MAASPSPWTLADIPDQSGRTAVITGPSVGGIGFHTALELARRGAHVVLAGRSRGKLEAASAAIAAEVSGARVTLTSLDLTSFAAVRRAAEAITELGPLDLLVNNAGVMATPPRRTAEGLELQIGTNHYGPFLLTGLVLPQVEAAPAGRVVTVASLAHTWSRTPPLGDPRGSTGRYLRWLTYSKTKLANLLFAYELDRRLRASGSTVSALAAHPGLARTHLITGSKAFGPLSAPLTLAYGLISQNAAGGALPSLMAATAELPGGTYLGPGGPGQAQGAPRIVSSSRLSHDAEAARRLWELSQEVTGLTWP